MIDYPPDKVELIQSLAKLRAELHLRRKKVADAIGVSSITVRNWEQGKNEPSSLAARRLVPAVEALREAVAKKTAAELPEKGTKK